MDRTVKILFPAREPQSGIELKEICIKFENMKPIKYNDYLKTENDGKTKYFSILFHLTICMYLKQA